MEQTMRFKMERRYRVVLTVAFGVAFLLAAAGSALAQQKDKKKKKDAAPVSDGKPIIPMNDEQQIDYMISSMLGAWQLGDVEKLHQSYADDVTIVNGVFAPPIVGWATWIPSYQQQRARMQQVRMDRTNTLIKVSGAVAWACYQWDFSASVDGQPSTSQGQTTLVMEKRNNRWLIVHNHTGLVQPLPASAPPSQTKPATR